MNVLERVMTLAEMPNFRFVISRSGVRILQPAPIKCPILRRVTSYNANSTPFAASAIDLTTSSPSRGTYRLIEAIRCGFEQLLVTPESRSNSPALVLSTPVGQMGP